MSEVNVDSNFVRYSRAGDVFHYRWAARRCLRMVRPNSALERVTIEGSAENEKAGEYVIDVAEYFRGSEGSKERIEYYQLKHTTKRLDDTFTLSDLRGAFEGFAKRFSEIHEESPSADQAPKLYFSIVTNRPFSKGFKSDISTLRRGGGVSDRFRKTIEKYTGLSGGDLAEFCRSLELVDGEGNYSAQRHELHTELSRIIAGAVDSPQIENLIALVQDRALPKSDGTILPEDVLQSLGVTSENDLFPAPFKPEDISGYVKREQHDDLLAAVKSATQPVIIHASGGVGKTVVAQQLASSLPKSSEAFVYDCFGSGTYRSRSASRHRHSTALVQIGNEIAAKGFCRPIIPAKVPRDEDIMRAFLSRLEEAIVSLREANPEASLAIFIDAADNAEMAAAEFNEPCFASQWLREGVPEGCRIVMLCRTERIDLLDPPNSAEKRKLMPFDRNESLLHLREIFPEATSEQAEEFHRLTGGNPRVQVNALSSAEGSVAEMLSRLGPSPTSVDEQIEAQLDSAVQEVKDENTPDFRERIEAVCAGLANLPPLIPIEVLAAAADVKVGTVKSFVADIGRPLWLSDDSVQFRDEPTETWFRTEFSATKQQIKKYIERLRPLAEAHSYVAETLPSLLLQAGEDDELIRLALSDDLLPENSPIDARSVRVYRLQFAFKAALKQIRYSDAAKLAFRAGEEMAGDSRQHNLLSKNTDLISPLQSQERVQELAYRRELKGAWDGSENVYSAALLSSIEDFKGEAQGYLRASHKWLERYFREREKNKGDDPHAGRERLHDRHIVEMAVAYFNLSGPEEAVNFILTWRPPEVVFRVTRRFIRRLIDHGNLEAIKEMAVHGSRHPYFVIAAADELIKVGRFPPTEALSTCLTLMCHQRVRVPKPPSRQRGTSRDAITPAIVSFVEACVAKGLCSSQAKRVIRHYTNHQALYGKWRLPFEERERDLYLRQLALRSHLASGPPQKIEDLLPDDKSDDQRNRWSSNERKRFKQVAGSLFPYYRLRVKLISGEDNDYKKIAQAAREESKEAGSGRWRENDFLPAEITRVRLETMIWDEESRIADPETLLESILAGEGKPSLSAHLAILRAACRLEHLQDIRDQLESSCSSRVAESAPDEGPEERARWYVKLARAVLPRSQADAAAYFDYAVEAVSKFGDEVSQRWQAVMAMARRSAEGDADSPERAYRFIRCAELVGESAVREKHFPRSESVRVTALLHPSSAFAGLSRWRDRRVGRFWYQLPALARMVVENKMVSPPAAWSLSGLYTSHFGYESFCKSCLEVESDPDRQRYIFHKTVEDLRLEEDSAGGPETKWGEMEQLAHRYGFRNPALDEIVAARSESQGDNEASQSNLSGSNPPTSSEDENSEPEWDSIFASCNLLNSEDLAIALSRFGRRHDRLSDNLFWEKCFERVDSGYARRFLQTIVEMPEADLWDVRRALSECPDCWKKKASVERAWSGILQVIGRRFASDVTSFCTGNEYIFNTFLDDLDADDSDVEHILEAVLEGLSQRADPTGAGTLFGVSEILSRFVSTSEASDVTDFALSRFEKHIDSDFADGPWDDWLTPPEDISVALSGFIWSALGSPRTDTRWRAAHCVRRLADLGCSPEIDALMRWMAKDKVEPFETKAFPFYNLHARLYLLIALSRVAQDHPGLLKAHHDVYKHHALDGLPHILIQIFAARTALSIERAFPGTYDSEVARQLGEVAASKMPARKEPEYGKVIDTPWHRRGEVDQSLDFYFAYDFDRYWFDGLARVFGVSAEQLEELARTIVVHDWEIEALDRLIPDQRDHIWRKSHPYRETWHDHSSYPKTDDRRFYVSYHALMSVAARLVSEMPVVHKYHMSDEPLAYWIQRHDITRPDGRWLSDRRDVPPVERREWTQEDSVEGWLEEVSAGDFLNGLFLSRSNETWLNVYGSWSDHARRREEVYNVASALVAPAGAQSLLNALSACANPYEYKLPEYGEGSKYDSSPFDLTGWVYRDRVSDGIDKMDPHAGDISYPPYLIGEGFASMLGVVPDTEKRKWAGGLDQNTVVASELWGKYTRIGREEPVRKGSRINASVDFLKRLCSSSGKQLIIEVRISRYSPERTYARNSNDRKERESWKRLYLLSADGTLRDTRTRYRIG